MLPALMPALVSSGAICFATSMGAFGTAFTLATQLDVLPLTIYNEFTNYANFGMAAALSVLLGAVTWALLALARAGSPGDAVAAPPPRRPPMSSLPTPARPTTAAAPATGCSSR